jgi:hypothetical protein
LASHFGFTIHEPDTSISLKPKPLFLIFGWWENLSFILMLLREHSFLWVIHVRRGLYSFGCF